MSLRPLSDHQRRWLTDELAHWQARELVNADLTGRIWAEYESTGDTSNRKRSIAQLALMGVAATFVGLAVLLIVGYNWDALPQGMKLVLIFGSIVCSNLLGLYLRFKLNRRGLAEVVFLLAALLYGAGIALVGNVFHLSGHPPDALWWWAVGVIPVALVLDTPLVHVVIVALLATWTGMEIFEYRHRGWWWWQTIPNAALSLPLLVLPGVIWAYRRSSSFTLGLYLAVAAWWIVLQCVAWDYERYTVLLVGIVGPLFLILAENHQVGNRLAAPYRFWGMLLTGGALIPLSYLSFHRHWWWGWAYQYESANESVAIVVAVFVWLVAIAAFATLLRPLGASPQPPAARLIAIAQRQWVPLGISAVMIYCALFVATRGAWDGGSVVHGAWIPTLVANVAMVVLALWLIQIGLREERGRTFAAGVCYLMLWSVLRYFDLFSDWGGVLGAALLFLLCGLTLFGLAMWWGKRKEVQHA